MKPKLIRILSTLSLAFFALTSAELLQAQDTGGGPTETYEGSDDKVREPINSPGESIDQHYKPQSSTVVYKDSASFTPKANPQRQFKSATENGKPETKQPSDDSILSFNFLYYIIQKYKLQDIVD